MRVAVSLQFRVLSLGLLEDWNIRIGMLPEREEILVGRLGLDLISRQSQCSATLQVRQGAYGIADNDPAVIENFLEFRSSFSALMRRQIRFAPNIDWIERPEKSIYAAARRTQFVGSGCLQDFDSPRSVALVSSKIVQCDQCVKCRQVAESD